MSRLVEDITAYLASLPQAETIQEHPEQTIVPQQTVDSEGRRALDVLERLQAGAADGTELNLGRTLGTGGMAVVRLAEQKVLGRDVAVKAIRDERRSEEATVALLREAWVTGALEHPNVVPVYDIAFDPDGSPQIVLKRIEGEVWAHVIADAERARQRFQVEDLLEWNLEIWMQVANAIRFAHSRHIIHRDIKPENVMIGEFGEVYVLDWGLAVSLAEDPSGRLPLVSSARDMAGTLAYMAPEMLGTQRGDIQLSEQTDIYLLSGVLYHAVSGRPPHTGENAMEIVSRVVESQPEFPAEHFPMALADICRRGMDPDPTRRYQTVEEMRAAVQQFLRHRGSARLNWRAERKLEQLTSRLDDVGRVDANELRQHLYILYGQCRFGFREALAAWPENQEARQGLRRAVRAMVEYELANGRAHSASLLLTELGDSPPSDLKASIEHMLQAEVARERRLTRLEGEVDPNIGWRTRRRFGLAIGLLWTAAPVGAILVDGVRPVTSKEMVVGTLAVLAIMAALLGLGWRQIRKSAFNRRIGAGAFAILVGSLVAQVGAWLVDIDLVRTQVMMNAIWFTGALLFVVNVERRLWPSTLGYLLAFVAAALMPEWRLYAMVASNALLTVNAVTVWRRPASAGQGGDSDSAP